METVIETIVGNVKIGAACLFLSGLCFGVFIGSRKKISDWIRR